MFINIYIYIGGDQNIMLKEFMITLYIFIYCIVHYDPAIVVETIQMCYATTIGSSYSCS